MKLIIIKKMSKKPMIQQPRPSTVKGHPGGPATNNPPRPNSTPPKK